MLHQVLTRNICLHLVNAHVKFDCSVLLHFDPFPFTSLCRKINFAARNVMLYAEILKTKRMYNEAAMDFIKMTGEVCTPFLSLSCFSLYLLAFFALLTFSSQGYPLNEMLFFASICKFQGSSQNMCKSSFMVDEYLGAGVFTPLQSPFVDHFFAPFLSDRIQI